MTRMFLGSRKEGWDKIRSLAGDGMREVATPEQQAQIDKVFSGAGSLATEEAGSIVERPEPITLPPVRFGREDHLGNFK